MENNGGLYYQPMVSPELQTFLIMLEQWRRQPNTRGTAEYRQEQDMQNIISAFKTSLLTLYRYLPESAVKINLIYYTRVATLTVVNKYNQHLVDKEDAVPCFIDQIKEEAKKLQQQNDDTLTNRLIAVPDGELLWKLYHERKPDMLYPVEEEIVCASENSFEGEGNSDSDNSRF